MDNLVDSHRINCPYFTERFRSKKLPSDLLTHYHQSLRDISGELVLEVLAVPCVELPGRSDGEQIGRRAEI